MGKIFMKKKTLIGIIVLFSVCICAFGGCSFSKELFNKKEGFYKTGSLNVVRWGFSTTLLRDGRVLVAGGASGYRGLIESDKYTFKSTEIYDPKTGKFTMGPDMLEARSGHVAVLLEDGRVLIAGGRYHRRELDISNFNEYLKTTEIYDPKSNKFYPGPELSPSLKVDAIYDRFLGILLNDGRVVLRVTVQRKINELPKFEIYDPKSNNIKVFTLPANFDNRWVLLDNGNILTMSGQVFNLIDNTFTFVQSAEMNYKTFYSTLEKEAIKLNDGRVLFIGGHCDYSSGKKVYRQNAEYYDPKLDKFVMIPTLMNVNMKKSMLLTLLNNGQVLIIGDEYRYSKYRPVERFDPVKNKFIDTKLYPPQRMTHLVSLKNNEVLLIGGTEFFGGKILPDCWLYKY